MPRQLEPEEILNSLSDAHKQCVEQVIKSENLLYAKLENSNHLAIGYISEDSFEVVIFVVNDTGDCIIEFQQSIASRYYLNRHAIGVFGNIELVDLSGNQQPEVYVWFSSRDGRQDAGDEYIFYSKQADGSYERVFTLLACRDRSSVQFTQLEGESKRRIVLTEDSECHRSWAGPVEHSEWFVTNKEFKFLRSWMEE